MPANLVQALENVAGVNQVSEGQAAVPAVRGLARGRTLILIDGARVTSERRVGPSATFLDPDVARRHRGRARTRLGRVRVGRLRRRDLRAHAPRRAGVAARRARSRARVGTGVPDRRGGGRALEGHRRAAASCSPRTRATSRTTTAPSARSSTPATPTTASWRASTQSAGPGLPVGRLAERLRPRHRASAQQLAHGALLLPDRGLASLHRRLRPAATSAGFSRVGFTGFCGTLRAGDRPGSVRRPPPPARSVERADVSAKDFQVRGFARAAARPGAARDRRRRQRPLRPARARRSSRRTTSTAACCARPRTCRSTRRSRVDTGVYAQHRCGGGRRRCRWPAACAATTSRRRTPAATSAIARPANGAASGFASLTLGSFGGFSVTAQVARGFRDPVLSDRYFRGPSGRGFITGNPDLEPETSLQFDLGVRYTAPRVRRGGLLLPLPHRRSDRALPDRRPTFFFFRNRGRARLRGFEVEAPGRPAVAA